MGLANPPPNPICSLQLEIQCGSAGPILRLLDMFYIQGRVFEAFTAFRRRGLRRAPVHQIPPFVSFADWLPTKKEEEKVRAPLTRDVIF